MEINSVSELRSAVKTAEAEFEKLNHRLPTTLYLGRSEYEFAIVEDDTGFVCAPEGNTYLGLPVIQVMKLDYLAVA